MKKRRIWIMAFVFALFFGTCATTTAPPLVTKTSRGDAIDKKFAELEAEKKKPGAPRNLTVKEIVVDKECMDHLLVRDFKAKFSALPKAKYPRLLTITFQSDMYPKCLDFLWWEPMKNRTGSYVGISVDAKESISGFYKYTIEIDLNKTPKKPFILCATTGETDIGSVYFEVFVRPEKWIAEISKE